MSEEEVYRLIERVRVYYQHLSRSDELNDEWYRFLKNYDASEINNAFDNYLKLERNRNRIPMPQDLTQGLLTLEQKRKRKEQNLGYVVRCNLCQREMSLEHYNEHYGRCLWTMYLMSVFKKQGREVEYELFEQLSESKFNEVYEKYKDYDDNYKLNAERIFKRSEEYDYS